ncbi:Leucyl-tRNA synthetase [Minicystis rosea]|nr:Leucyl-tRNA synthetase [Minicystis rosea]
MRAFGRVLGYVSRAMSSETPPRAAAESADPARYNHAEVEARWQRLWDEKATFKAERSADRARPKRYVLDMFPYPSGNGLHVGHPEGYTATDIRCRYDRMRGVDVLHPMGWDAFGLPAEQHAVRTGTHPAQTTKQNIATFKRQLKSLGFSYDWSREVDTTDPGYVRWTQWIFLQLFKKGLAYQDDKVTVNWCPALGTVLANEEVIDGKSEIGGHPVERVKLRQWMMKITAYADRLLDDLALVDWPNGTLTMQREWIGRSEGANITFAVAGQAGTSFDVFTTRPDTLMGCTYAVLAPEHPLVAQITTAENKAAVDEYVVAASRKSDRDRTADTKKKTGVPTGAKALHPITGAEVPIWVADYVIGTYGTGAVMAVPAHDERDFAFAKTFGLPIVEVVSPDGKLHGELKEAFTGPGTGVQSGEFDGLATPDMKKAIVKKLEGLGRGSSKVTYKLRDWVFSRQRYWGEPIPVYFPVETAGDPRKGDAHTIRYDQPIAVDESELPLRLPELTDYRPGNDPAGPLSRAVDWRFFQKDGKWFARETNTMPQWAGSCWYYLRFLDPRNDAEGWSEKAYDDWMPVDLYVGGAEHAVLHLLYARFWHKVLFDLGKVKHPEPFMKLVHQGMILGEIEYGVYEDKETHERVSAELVKAGGSEDTGFVHVETGRALVLSRVLEADVERRGAFSFLKGTNVRLPSAMAHKMSKSRGNVVNPDDIVKAHGADVLRLYEMFMGPLEAVKPWQMSQIQGVVRFRDKVWSLGQRPVTDEIDEATKRLLHKTIKKVSGDIESMAYNTAISAMMVLANHLAELKEVPREAMRALTLIISPFTPHIGEELWQKQGNAASLAYEPWPSWDEALCVDDEVEMAVQVNGKVRGRVTLGRNASEDEARAAALAADGVSGFTAGKAVKKFIYVPGKIVNIVVG